MDRFHKYHLDLPHLYSELSSAYPYEEITKGRWGAILVDVTAEGTIPLVRTTTPYQEPSYRFTPLHHLISHEITSVTNIPHLHFNNILAEIYDHRYTKMKFHSDQALDLADNSYIALFSCYGKDNPHHLRHLQVRCKKNSFTPFSIPLEHNSVVLFSIETNRVCQHAIVLPGPHTQDELWLGLTLRQSHTYLNSDNSFTSMADKQLELCTPFQRKEFLSYRKLENSETNFVYPPLTYTLSPGDLLPPK